MDRPHVLRGTLWLGLGHARPSRTGPRILESGSPMADPGLDLGIDRRVGRGHSILPIDPLIRLANVGRRVQRIPQHPAMAPLDLEVVVYPREGPFSFLLAGSWIFRILGAVPLLAWILPGGVFRSDIGPRLLGLPSVFFAPPFVRLFLGPLFQFLAFVRRKILHSSLSFPILAIYTHGCPWPLSPGLRDRAPASLRFFIGSEFGIGFLYLCGFRFDHPDRDHRFFPFLGAVQTL